MVSSMRLTSCLSILDRQIFKACVVRRKHNQSTRHSRYRPDKTSTKSVFLPPRLASRPLIAGIPRPGKEKKSDALPP